MLRYKFLFKVWKSSKFLFPIEEKRAHGTNGFEDWLMRYHGKELRSPIRREYYPRDSFVNWHLNEVFRGPARYHTGLKIRGGKRRYSNTLQRSILEFNS